MTASNDAIVLVTRKVLEVSKYILVSRFLFQARALAWLFRRLDWKGTRYMTVHLSVSRPCRGVVLPYSGLSPLSFRSVPRILSFHALRKVDYFLVCASP